MPLPETETGGMPVFTPSVPTASTNLLASATGPAPEVPIFAGYQRDPDQTTIGMYDQTRTTKGKRRRVELTKSQWLAQFDDSTRKDFLQMRNLFAAAGLVAPDAAAPVVRSAFASVLGDLEDMAVRGITLSPNGYVNNLIRMNGLDPKDVPADADYVPFPGEAPFTGDKKTVSRSVSDVSEGEAWYTLQRTLSTMLGRDPNDQEVRNFAYRMNGLAAQNPSISKTITHYKDGEAVSSTTNTSGGFGEADIAQEAYDTAQNDDDYAEFQAASVYFDALQSAIQPIGQTS